jgi:uncharacterized protein
MAHGFSLTRHDGLAAYAERLAAAGAAVLVFDHRYLGDSPGEPRQRFRKGAQREDWHAAVAFARQSEGIDPERIVLWGFSFGGGHAIETTAADARVAATIALFPLVDGLARVLSTPPRLSAWLLPRALADKGRHNLIPVTGQPGEHAALTRPGEADGFHAITPAGSPWRNEVSPAEILTLGLHRPLARARRLHAPLWLGLAEYDVTGFQPRDRTPGRKGATRRASPVSLRSLRLIPRRRARTDRCRTDRLLVPPWAGLRIDGFSEPRANARLRREGRALEIVSPCASRSSCRCAGFRGLMSRSSPI